MLVEFAASDPDASVRAHSLELLANARRTLASKWVKTLVTSGLDSEIGRVRTAALKLLAAKGNVRLLSQIHSDLGPGSSEAALEVRARETPSAALRALVTDPYSHNDAIEESLLGNPRKLPASTLRSGLSTSFFRTRILCLRALERSHRLRRADLDTLLSDDNSKVRDEALRIASRKGWKVDQEIADEITRSSDLDIVATSELQIAYFMTLTHDELRKRLKWIGGDGWNVYAALGITGGQEAAEHARTDLDSEFSAMRAAYRSQVRRSIERKLFDENQELALRKDKTRLEELIERELATFFDRYEHLDPFTVKRFQASALRVLTKLGKPSDADYARKLLYSNEFDVVLAAIRLLARFGSPEDAAKVVDASGQLYFEKRTEGVRTGVALAEDKVSIATQILASDDDTVRLIGIEALEGVSLEKLKEILLPLLNDDSDSIRAAATEQLSKRLNGAQRRKLLDAYSNSGYYFYNVVARIDRGLYAPGWLQTARQDG
ncbi:MAG TPA: hypothetical protein VIP57_06610 [Candidatus Dormibacteraeota bacterium]